MSNIYVYYDTILVKNILCIINFKWSCFQHNTFPGISVFYVDDWKTQNTFFLSPIVSYWSAWWYWYEKVLVTNMESTPSCRVQTIFKERTAFILGLISPLISLQIYFMFLFGTAHRKNSYEFVELSSANIFEVQYCDLGQG